MRPDSTARRIFDSSASPSTRESSSLNKAVFTQSALSSFARVLPTKLKRWTIAAPGLRGVLDERMARGEPAHRHVAAIARDLLGRDGAALLGDVEQRLEEHAP